MSWRRIAGWGMLCLALAITAAVIWAKNPLPSAPLDRPLSAMTIPVEGPLRIVVFGTSLSYDEDWTTVYRDQLEICLDHPVEVTVVAKPGAGSTWALGEVPSVRAVMPHLVLAEFAINDADLRDGVWPEKGYQQHLELARLLTEPPSAPAVLWMTMSPAHGLRGWLRPRLDLHYTNYRRLAEATDTALLDLWPRWLALPEPARTFSDGLHPTSEQATSLIVPPLLSATAMAFERECAI